MGLDIFVFVNFPNVLLVEQQGDKSDLPLPIIVSPVNDSRVVLA